VGGFAKDIFTINSKTDKYDNSDALALLVNNDIYKRVLGVWRTDSSQLWYAGEMVKWRKWTDTEWTSIAVNDNYTIEYNANGGYGYMDKETVLYDKSHTLTLNKFVRPEYTFKGWATNPNATTALYANGASVSKLISMGNTKVLYAVWQANT
jgi:hypothetical protein